MLKMVSTVVCVHRACRAFELILHIYRQMSHAGRESVLGASSKYDTPFSGTLLEPSGLSHTRFSPAVIFLSRSQLTDPTIPLGVTYVLFGERFLY